MRRLLAVVLVALLAVPLAAAPRPPLPPAEADEGDEPPDVEPFSDDEAEELPVPGTGADVDDGASRAGQGVLHPGVPLPTPVEATPPSADQPPTPPIDSAPSPGAAPAASAAPIVPN